MFSWWFDEVHIPGLHGEGNQLKMSLFSKTEGHMDYQNLKRKSDHVKGGPFLVLLPSMLCRAKEKRYIRGSTF